MVIDIGKLEKGSHMNVEFCEKIQLPKAYLSKANPLIKAQLDISNVNGRYIVKGIVNTVLSLTCDKCLEAFEKNISYDINEVYERNEKTDEEIYLFEGSKVDLSDMLISNTVLNIPMKAVCKEDCKGLCYKCGQNLNVSECGCDRAYVNPYFEDINILFDDKEV